MLVLVTGAAGYVGVPATSALLAAGHTVRAIDSLCFGGAGLLGLYPSGRFRLVRGDIRDRALLAQALDGVDAIVHLAGIVGDPACAADPDTATEVNLAATIELRKTAEKARVGRLVFASSCSVYGHGQQLADETFPARPLSLYARTKLDAEADLLAAGRVPATVLRFATLYGLAPRMRFDLVVNTMTAHAVSNGTVTVHAPAAWRPLIHVGDIATAITAVLDTDPSRTGGQIFNVADRAGNYQLQDIARHVAYACGPGVRIDTTPVTSDARDYRVNGDKLTRTCGWRPRRQLDDGIAEIAHALVDGLVDNRAVRHAG